MPRVAGVFTGISDVFWALMVLRVEQCSTCCASVGPNLVRSCRQSLPSGGMLDLTWTSMCVYVRHNWRQLGVLLAPRWGNLGPSCPILGPTRPRVGANCDAHIRTWKSKSGPTCRRLEDFGDSFAPSWAQRRHNMWNIAQHEAPSMPKKRRRYR